MTKSFGRSLKRRLAVECSSTGPTSYGPGQSKAASCIKISCSSRTRRRVLDAGTPLRLLSRLASGSRPCPSLQTDPRSLLLFLLFLLWPFSFVDRRHIYWLCQILINVYGASGPLQSKIIDQQSTDSVGYLQSAQAVHEDGSRRAGLRLCSTAHLCL